MHFANYVGDLPNKLRTVHDKLVVHVHQSRNFRRISLEEERIAGMLYPEWQLFMLQECLAAYRWLRCQDVPSHRIILAGDSAGGGLVLSALVALRDAGDDLPAASPTRRVPPVSIVELEIWNDMVHIWPFFAVILPEGQQAIEPMGKFARARVVSA